jgi:molybdenum cofactor synthesis domain-containing protein
MKKIRIQEAPGEILDYDITGVDPERGTKGRIFRRGHQLTDKDLERLRDLGREQVYVKDGNDREVHEDDAAILSAPLIAGKNIIHDPEPSEGKIQFYAKCDGVFRVDVDRLFRINSLEIPSLPTIHSNLPVRKEQMVAAFRIIPLTCPVEIIDSMKNILSEPLFSCEPYTVKNASIIVTGNEIASGRKKDAFIPALSGKLKQYGIEKITSRIVPDSRETISAVISEEKQDAEIILITGGTSVDPDDATKQAMMDAGVNLLQKGNPVQPGNNLSIGYLAGIPVCSVPAAALTYHATALDIFLPRLFAKIDITKENIIRSAHGGLCHFCTTCSFPLCPFGRGA